MRVAGRREHVLASARIMGIGRYAHKRDAQHCARIMGGCIATRRTSTLIINMANLLAIAYDIAAHAAIS